MGNCHPSKINVNLRFASVDIGFLGVTVSHVTLSCIQYLYNIPCYVMLGYEKWYTSLLLVLCGELHAFEVQNHVKNMYISRFLCGVDLVHFVLAFEKSFLIEALLFQINLSCSNISLIKIGKQRKLLLIILSLYSTNTCNSD